VAPSSLRPGRSARITEVIRRSGKQALERGTLIHGWFERVCWIEKDAITDETLLKRIGLGGPFVSKCCREFRKLLQAPCITRLLTEAHYRDDAQDVFGEPRTPDMELTVCAEHRFDVPTGAAMLSGSVDRLVLFYRDGQPVAADVLDFKTDAVRGEVPAWQAEMVERYRHQLAAYGDAVAAVYHLPRPRVVTRLVLLEIPDIVTVPHTQAASGAD
jgi:ATP-dependent exoDNAse (exonuclease V) beta subunit